MVVQNNRMDQIKNEFDMKEMDLRSQIKLLQERIQEDEDQPVIFNKAPYKITSIEKKLKIVDHAKEISAKSASKLYQTSYQNVTNWMNTESKLRQSLETQKRFSIHKGPEIEN